MNGPKTMNEGDKLDADAALAGYPPLTAEDRASMFIGWCALMGFGLEGWPPGAYERLVAHLDAMSQTHEVAQNGHSRCTTVSKVARPVERVSPPGNRQSDDDR